MPIYEYRCTSCGFQKEYLQKVSDPVLTVCPECRKETFAKQVTAAGFQLKGSGWYATDFKGSGAPKTAKSDTGDNAAAKGESGAEGKSDTKSDGKAETKSDAKAAAKPESKTTGAASGAGSTGS